MAVGPNDGILLITPEIRFTLHSVYLQKQRHEEPWAWPPDALPRAHIVSTGLPLLARISRKYILTSRMHAGNTNPQMQRPKGLSWYH
jgi:hypothetical protein